MNALNSIEIGLLHSLHDFFVCDLLDLVLPIITSLSNAGIIWIVIALALLPFKKTRQAGLSMGIALLLGLIFGNILLKPIVARTRPYDFDTSVLLLIAKEKDFSFPSGHTMAAFEGAVALFLNNKKVGVAALVLAFVTAFSRLYLMVHYPSDVLVGMLLGTVLALLAYKLTLMMKSKTELL